MSMFVNNDSPIGRVSHQLAVSQPVLAAFTREKEAESSTDQAVPGIGMVEH